MDNPNGATSSDTIEHLTSMSAPIVSTLTTATPITSEIVSDFESDSKFEITTLEMASYDCQDLYSTANLLEPQDVEPHSSANATGMVVSGVTQHETQNSMHSEQITLIESHKPIEEEKSKGPSENLTSAKESHRDLEQSAMVEPTLQIQDQHDPASTKLDVKLDQPNDCKPDNAEKNIVIPDTSSSLVPQAQADQIVTDSSTVMQPTEVDSNSGEKSVSDHESTDLFSDDRATKNTDLNVHPLSQTSVDAQMEKVIDNIVELGGVHQFPQSLVNPEGKEEFLATIHREMTGERGSIDLIADVASRQKSIEIEPIAVLNEHQERDDVKETESVGIPENENPGKCTELELTEKTTDVPERSLPLTDNEPAKTETETVVDQDLPFKEEVVEEKVVVEKIVEEKSIEEKVVGEKVAEEKVLEEKPVEEKVVEEKVLGHKVPVRSSRRRGANAKEKTTDNARLVQSSNLAEEVAEVPAEKVPEMKVDDSNRQTGVSGKDTAEKDSTGKDTAEDDPIGEAKVEEEKMEYEQVKTRSLRPRGSLKRKHADDNPVDNPPKAEPPKKQMKKSRGSTNEHAPIIKLPNFRSRTTISSSDPITRLDKKYETKAPTSVVPIETGKKYVCEQCGYATDRLNNLVYHSTKSFCQGKCQIGEVMKADIIRQQQQAKNKRRSMR